MLTTLITGGRQSGKTTQLEKLKKGLTVLVVPSVHMAKERARNANLLHYIAALHQVVEADKLKKYDTILLDNIDLMGPEALALISYYQITAEIHASVTPMVIEDKENPPWQYTIKAKTRVQLEASSEVQKFAESMEIKQAVTQLYGAWVICE
ncbi:hypothetical protein LCGC14_1162510 [marine sediment metagenome]|uniref:Uncharacterized protein n=1 Tax=marine sediment metagenome TaxID=412755 RepID=A0A0F9PXT2_9ZZZZ